MKYSLKSDTGRVREVNQDCVLAYSNIDQTSTVLAVADGLGGHNAGEVASVMAMQAVHEVCKLREEKNYVDCFADFYQAVRQVNLEIFNRAQTDAHLSMMGTTVTLAVMDEMRLKVLNVGDSRCYRINTKGILQLTKDHSLVQQMVDEGKLSLEQAQNHALSNVITRAVGTQADVEIDCFAYRLRPGNMVVVCSDGLYRHVDKEMMAKILRRTGVEKGACALVDAANEDGGSDNISVAVCKL